MIKVFFIFVSFFIAINPTLAQEISSTSDTNICFDNYFFGSVQTSISPSTESSLPSLPIDFTGYIVNNNTYPVTSGRLYVKIFRERENIEDANSADVIDQFIVKENIAIKSGGTYPISFTWKVPENASKGQYKISSFFLTNERYNLLGLTFTDDIVGNTTDFFIDGENTNMVKFEKEKVKINNSPYFFAAFPPKFGKDEVINITSSVENSTDKRESASVLWEIYEWDAQQKKNLVRSESQEIILSPKQKKNISVRITESNSPVYLVIGTLSWKDTKSIINVRVVREGIDKIRINFPSIKSYPISTGVENDVFSCLHNSGTQSIIENGKLHLKLSDETGEIIHEYSYSGDVTGEMMGVINKFVPKKDYKNFFLEATLSQDDKVVETVKVKYLCSEIDPSICDPETSTATTESSYKKYLNYIYITLFAGILLLILLIVVINKRKNI